MKKIHIGIIAICCIISSIVGIYQLTSNRSPDNVGKDQQPYNDSENTSTLRQVPQDGMGNQFGYYFMERSPDDDQGNHHYNLKYIDYESKQLVYLTNQPNSKHDDPSCPSYYPGGTSDYFIYTTDKYV